MKPSVTLLAASALTVMMAILTFTLWQRLGDLQASYSYLEAQHRTMTRQLLRLARASGPQNTVAREALEFLEQEAGMDLSDRAPLGPRVHFQMTPIQKVNTVPVRLEPSGRSRGFTPPEDYWGK